MRWRRLFGASDAEPRIAPASLRDAERLSEIHASAFARPWSEDDFEGFLLDGAIRVDCLFLGRARQPAGFALSRIVPDEAEILSLALARSARGLGHSRLLLAHHLHGLAHAGVRTVHLEVEQGNEPALALYRRLGFQQTGIRPGYYARPDGARTAALSMTRTLGGGEAALAR